jgi:tetratricopeptide (TPR) repeat protein
MSSQTLTSFAITPVTGTLPPAAGASRLPVVPWRDPHTVSPQQLGEAIASLKEACALNPGNADLRVCLGIAYAMNYDVYSSMDILEEARALEPRNFSAQFKFAELQYRLRALHVAETETLKALELASNAWELSQARHQLSEIRRMTREGTIKPTWTRSLAIPAICLGLLLGVVTLLFMVIR